MHAELSERERNDPASLQELRIAAARSEIDQAAHLLSVANVTASSREDEIKRLQSRVSTLEKELAGFEAHIEELHTEWEQELKVRVEWREPCVVHT